MTRRAFSTTVAAAAGASALAATSPNAFAAPGRKPNFLFINLDQLSCEAIGHLGCEHVDTPNLDRLAKAGMSFSQSYSADPVCCPARSAWFSGRMTPETGVIYNSKPMIQNMPDIGQWLGARGYDVFYTGKWHIPGRDVAKSFKLLSQHQRNTADLGDITVTRTAEGFFKNHKADKPFFLSVGLLNPHDICSMVLTTAGFDGKWPYPELDDQLPPLPPNFDINMAEPANIVNKRNKYWQKKGFESNMGAWDERLVRYYIWAYYRYTEMVDGQIGLILDALENSAHASDTIVILSSDHGDGHIRHKMVFKSFLYDEAVRVPFIISWPGHIKEGVIDHDHLVSGVDVMPTVCDYAGVESPPKMRGHSLRPLAEGRAKQWRDFVVAHSGPGTMLRTNQYKYITYDKDPVVQLFDMKADPWETKNLADDKKMASVVKEHQERLAAFVGEYELAKVPKPKWQQGKAKGKA